MNTKGKICPIPLSSSKIPVNIPAKPPNTILVEIITRPVRKLTFTLRKKLFIVKNHAEMMLFSANDSKDSEIYNLTLLIIEI